jgi:lipoprotein-releasing system permease protein
MFIANRLRLAPSDGGRRSPAVGIAVGGVALAVIVMMASIAIVVGFQDAIRQKVAGFEASMSLHPLGNYYANESNIIELSDVMAEALHEGVPQGQVALVVKQPVVLKAPENFAGIVLQGYSSSHDFSFEQSNLIEGELPKGSNDLVISSMTAGKLGVGLGDRVDGCFFLDGAMKLRRFTVCGIYTSNFGDYDRLTGYADISMLQKLRGLESTQGDVIEIRGLAIDEIADATQQLQKSLGERYDNRELTDGVSVATLFDSGAMYFNWLALLDANVVVILIIMSLVSGFTLISCVFILILQRVRMIGVLKSLGATNRQIRRVFMLLGLRVVGLGLLIGNCVGIALLLLQAHFHLLPLDPDSYYLTYVPVLLDWRHVLLLNAGAVVLAGMLLLIPASLVSRISPAKTMHYE